MKSRGKNKRILGALKASQSGFGYSKLSYYLFLFSLLGIFLVSVNLYAVENPGSAPVNELRSSGKRANIYRTTPTGRPLSSQSSNAPIDIVKNFLLTKGHGVPTLNLLTTKKEFVDNTGIRQIRMEQEINGLKVYEKYIKAEINESGELITLIEDIISPPAGGLTPAGVLHDQALSSALRRFYPDLLTNPSFLNQDGNTHVFSKGESFSANPKVTSIAIPYSNETVEEGYLVEIWDNNNILRHIIVNAQGRVIKEKLLTAFDSYNVFPTHPDDSVQSVVAGPGAGNTESPAGWVTSDTTTGNNTDAYLDTDNDNLPDVDGRPISATQDFLTPFSLNLPPDNQSNQMAAVQNAFYWVNVIHDEMFKAGFDEASGAFQTNNFNAPFGGLDPVKVDVQDSGDINNAFMTTPLQDGESPRMTLTLWDKTLPRRDVAADADVIWHEYTHGVTWRMIQSVSGPIGGAFGEGMSDTIAAIMTDNDVIGEYVENDPGGIRRYPYTNFPGTYIDYLVSTSIHSNGEFLAASMWKLWETWKEKGYSRDDLVFRIVNSFHSLPYDPSFGEARDALASRLGPSRECLAWEAFAFFGIGDGSSISATNLPIRGFQVTAVSESFDLPSQCLENDTIVPSDVIDLSLVSANSRSAEFSFTAVGDDGQAGTATSYDLRYSTQPITEVNFDTAKEVSNEPRPSVAGTTETAVVSNLEPDTTYYFAMKVRDNGGNSSGLSNVITATMSPSVDVFFDDFENSSSNWIVEGTDGVGGSTLWHLSAHRYKSVNTAFYYGIDATLNYDTGAANSGSITSIPIDLTTSVDSWVSFSQYLETEGVNSFYDMTRVEVSVDDGFTWDVVHANYSDTGGQMADVGIDLSKYDGEIILFRFVFDSFDENANGFEGWIIDDFRISSTDTGLNNVTPSANAGIDQVVDENVTVFLNGIDSIDQDGSIASYSWLQTAGPVVALQNVFSESPSFTTPVAAANTILTFQLTVTDNNGSTDVDSAHVTIAVSANVLPISNAGNDQVVNEGGNIVTLDGSSSNDSDGIITDYLWQQISGPTVVLANNKTNTTTFASPVVSADTILTFKLSVTDNFGDVSTDIVNVTVQNSNILPTADAGLDQMVNEVSIVSLNGTGSIDTDGIIASYLWTQTGGPTVTLLDTSAPTTSFIAPFVIDISVNLSFELTVTDNIGESSTDVVIITVQEANQLPIANAGADQTVNEGVVVSFDAIASYDIDGTIVSYAWVQTAGPVVTLNGADTITPSVTTPNVPADTLFTFELIVTDNNGGIKTDSVNITVINGNDPPIANAGPDQTALEGELVNLDGAASIDTDGTIVSYSWSQPLFSGAWVTIINPNTATPSFYAPCIDIFSGPENIRLRLTVTDNEGLTSTDDVWITVDFNAELFSASANAGIDQTVTAGSIITLDSTGSVYPANVVMDFNWSQYAGPAVTLADPTAVTTTFTAPEVTVDTVLSFQLDMVGRGCGYFVDFVDITVQPAGSNQPPVANAGIDQTVNEGSSASLDGTGSSDPDGTISSYSWTQTAGPAVTLTGGTTATPGFTAPAVTADTVLTFQLAATDDAGATATDLVSVTVQNSNQLPTANAGIDQTVNEGVLVGLDGSGSTDTDGTITSYAWTQTAGSVVSLTGATTASASFTAPDVTADTVLTFQLIVTDNVGETSTDLVNITVQNVNQIPVANAGVDQSVNEDDVVGLDGSASSDPDGTIASYAWVQTAGPAVTITGATTATASFTALEVTTDTILTFQLTVTDNDGATATDLVNVTVQNVNQLPTANADVDQTVNEGDAVALDGTASSDPDGTIATYAWIQTAGPVVTLTGVSTASVSFTAPDVTVDTVLTFQLTITDNDGATATDLVNVTVQNVNQLPVANAGLDQTVNEGAAVSLDGTGSGDPDGTIASYAWIQTAGPAVTLTGETTTLPGFTAPAVTANTVLTFQLTTTDDAGATATDLVDVTVQNSNQLPTANAGVDQTVNEGTLVGLDGSGSTDTDGTITTYAWAQTAGPVVSLTGATTVSASFTALDVTADTILTFQLTVTDNVGETSTDLVNIIVQNVNQLPVANAGIDQSVNEGDVVGLNGSTSSDPDGTIASYAWVQTAGPAVTITGATTATASFTALEVTTDTILTFQLTVTDNDGATATDLINVTVQNVNQLPTTNAGIDQTVNEGDAVALDGSASSDPDGTIITYAWIQTAGPVVTLTGPATATASFSAPDVTVDTVLTFQLTVTDNDGATATDLVNVTVQNVNQLPVATAGTDQIVNEGDVVGLNGSASSDADGTIASYSWTQTAGPVVTLSGSATSTPLFAAPSVTVDTILTFQLTVTDNDGGTGTDLVNVTVQNVNGIPVANAGIDQTVNEGEVVGLDGSASSDADGTITGYAWAQTAGPVVTLTGAITATASFTAPEVTTNTVLTFQLTITDNDGATATDLINVTVQNVNQLPVANAGADQTVNEGAAVSLNGSASNDADGTIASYAWSQTSGPVVTLTGATTSIASFAAPDVATDTVFTFQLTVTDNDGGTAIDAINVTVQNVNQLPTANAGADQIVNEGVAVSLSGTLSTDIDGTISSYAWIQTAGPIVILTGAATATASIIAPDVTADTVLTFQLTVTDNDGGTGTDLINVTSQNVNQLPTADAGVDQTVNEGDTASLNGSASNDPDGTIASYAWTQTAGPVVTLTGAATAAPSFTAPDVTADTILTFQLTVTDNDSGTATDIVNVTVQNVNQLPVANSGADQIVNEGDAVSLDGTGSSDADGTIASNSWIQTVGTTVTLSGASTSSPSFTAPDVSADEILTFQLTVTDNDGGSGADLVNITVQNVNQLPVANAGVDQVVNESDAVSLTGSASSDPDGTIANYAWTQTLGPVVTLTGATTATPSFTAPDVAVDIILTFQLTVTDNDGGTSTDLINVTSQNVNQLPTADAGVDQTVNEGDSTSLNGSASNDPDGTVASYAWTQTAGPVVTLTGAATVAPSFTAPDVTADTILTFQLTVTDNDSGTATDIVNVTVQNVNQLPVANVGVDQTVSEGDAVLLNGTASSDPDGTITGYSWTQTAGPIVTLTGASTSTASFTAPDVTTNVILTFQLTVTDNDGGTGTDLINITVQNVNQLPTANAGIDQTVNEGSVVSLDGASSSDTDGTITSYAWTQTAGPVVTLTGAATATAGFTSPAVTTNTVLTFQLTVTDNDGGIETDLVNVTVQNVNQLPIANAGVDQTVNEGDNVSLDGTSSSDPDGTIASYNWVQTAGTAVTLASSTTATPSFTAPDVSADTILTFEISVTDNVGSIATDTVSVTVQNINQLPTANAGVDQIVNGGDAVSLDGTGSSDADGTIASYSWTQTVGTTATLSGASTSSPSFTAPDVSADEVLTFQLTVTDNDGGTTSDSVDITVTYVDTAYKEYYILNPNYTNGNLKVVSLADNNIITAGNTTLNLNNNDIGIIPGSDLSQGTLISGTQPFSAGSNVDGTDMPATAIFLGTQFVVPHYRGTHKYYILSPNGDASVQIDAGSGGTLSVTAYEGQVQTVNAGSDNYISSIITSDLPILVVHRAIDYSTEKDIFPVPPVATEIWGLRSKVALVGALQDNTSVVVYSSSGSSTNFILDAGEKKSITIGYSSYQGEGSALHIIADKPVAAIQVEDDDVYGGGGGGMGGGGMGGGGDPDDNYEATAFWQTNYLSDHYGIPVDTQYIAVVCPESNTTVKLYNGTTLVSSKSCSASGLYPGKTYFGSSSDGTYVNAGRHIESTKPVYVIYEPSSTEEESNLLGDLISFIQGQLHNNAVPVANPGGPYAGLTYNSVVFDGSGSSDLDGDALFYSWLFGDGGAATGINPTHTYTNPGTYLVTLLVNDGTENSAPVSTTATITIPNNIPLADPGGPYFSYAGTAVTFNGSGSSDLDGEPLTYLWDFGDGNTGSGLSPSHTYISQGNYTVTLTVNDGISDSVPVVTSASVAAANQLPVADPGGPYTGTANSPVTLNGSASTDPELGLLTYQWDFGDSVTGVGVNPSHTYTLVGTYVVTLMVNDGINDSAVVTTTVTISQGTPVANVGGPYSGLVNTIISFNGSGSSDPEGDALTYQWSFGDGVTGTGQNTTHTYTSPGEYVVSLIVNDGVFNSVASLTTVSVLSVGNNAPIISDVSASSIVISDTETLQLQVAASDPDLDSLTYNWIVLPGQGTFNDATLVNPVYTPPVVTGLQTFILTAEVSDGATTVSQTIDITVVDAAGPGGTLLDPAIALGGNITVDSVLQANQTYQVTSDIIVDLGVTLTIQEGVSLIFGANVSLIVDGRILVLGTNIANVQFLPVTPTTIWTGLSTRITSVDNVISYARIEGASTSISSAGSKIVINNTNILQNNRSGAGIQAFTGSTGIISNSQVTMTASSPLQTGINLVNSTLDIIGNTIDGYVTGVKIDNSTGSVLEGNTIKNNAIGASVNSAVTVSRNIFENNTTNLSALGAGIINAEYNWWGDTSITAIADKIYDYSDFVPYSYFNNIVTINNTSLIDFTPYLDTPNGNPVVMNYLDGELAGDTVLVANTVYTVGGSLIVPVGVTLSIPPGTTIEFAESRSRISVYGTLIADGTPSQPIIFTSAQAFPTSYNWHGIVIYSTSSSNVIDHIKVEYASTGLDLVQNDTDVLNSELLFNGNGISLIESNSLIQNNTLSNSGTGIILEQSSPTITFNVIQNNSSGIDASYSSPSINNNNIQNNSTGISINQGSSPLINNNVISNNQDGISIRGDGTAAGNPTPVVNRNQIVNTRYNYLVSGSFFDGANITLNAVNNWWGTSNIHELAASIIDRVDNNATSSTLAYVDYVPFLDGPNGKLVTSLGDNYLSGSVSTNATLLSGQIYEASDLYVSSGVTLTIQAGVTINFGLGDKLIVDGTLIIEGTALNPVVLKLSDLAIENYSGTTTPSWAGIEIGAGSIGNSINYAVIDGNGGQTSFAFIGVNILGGDITVTNTTFVDCATGIYMRLGASGLIENNQFVVNVSNGGNGIRIDASAATVSNNNIQFADSGTGMIINNASPTVTGNTIQNTGTAISITGTSNPLINANNTIVLNSTGILISGNSSAYPAPIVNGNNIYSNTTNVSTGDAVGGLSLSIDFTGNWWGTTDFLTIARSMNDLKKSMSNNYSYAKALVDFQPYLNASTPAGTPISQSNYLDGVIAVDTTLLSGNEYIVGRIVVPAGITLTIEAGVILRFMYGGIIVDGSLIVQGTLPEEVIFTSIEDPQAKSDWRGIVITNSATNVVIDYARIEYADRGIYFINSSGTISNSVIQFNQYGIYAEGASNPTISDNTIMYNTYGIFLRGNLNDASNPQPIITGNDLVFNTNGHLTLENYGSASTIVINASGNWWGTATPIIGTDIVLFGTNASVDATNAATEKLGGPRILNLALSNTSISPNGDGLRDTVSITANMDVFANWTLTIKNNSGATVRTFTGSSTTINQTWDGRDNLSVVVPVGTYTISVSAVNASSGKPSRYPVRINVGVDNEVPQAQITSPTSGSTVFESITITGTASDVSSIQYYLLDYGFGASPTDWKQIGTSTTPVINGTLMTWHTNPFVDNAISNGTYTLRLTVVDIHGNSTTDTVTLILDNLIITDVTRSSASFIPTQRQTSDINFTIDKSAQVIVRIVPELSDLKSNGDQTPETDAIRTMNLGTLAAGAHTVTWDGKDDVGNYVPDEAYIYVVEGTTATGRYAKFNQYNLQPTITPILPFDYEIPEADLVNLNPYTNTFISSQFQVLKGPARWSLNVSGDTSSSTPFNFHPQYNVLVEAGVPQEIFWDGRDELGDILDVTNVDYIPVGINGDHEFTPLKSNYIIVKGGKPKIPGVSIKADPYLVHLSYGQVTRIKYTTEDSANITITVKNPVTGIESIILDSDPQSAGNHAFVWDGKNSGILMPDEGHYTFTITATHPRTGFSTVRRGNITIFK